MTYADHEAKVLANATKYIACDFRSNGTYVKEERPTLAGAVIAARILIGRRNRLDPTRFSRPVLVHAWDSTEHAALSDTVYP